MSSNKKNSDNNKLDINVKLIEHKKISDDSSNFLKINISGSIINYIILNTLRRVIYELIPAYAFTNENIIIEKNTSIFNNDYMRLRLINFPIWGIINDIDTLDQLETLENNANTNTFDMKKETFETLKSYEEKKIMERIDVFTMKIDIKNNTPNILNVTTSQATFIYKGNVIESPYKKELLIIKLKPGEEFLATCYSTLHIPIKKINFLQCSACNYEQINDTSFDFYIESSKQITEKNLLIRACMIVIKKITNLNNSIITKLSEYNNNDKKDNYDIIEDVNREQDTNKLNHLTQGILKIEHESHTFGNIITRLLQDDEDITFAGFKIDQLLIKELTISYKTNGKNIKDIFNRITSKCIKIFEKLQNNFENLKIE